MSIFIKFNNGRYLQFDECDTIKFTYAIEQGYEL